MKLTILSDELMKLELYRKQDTESFVSLMFDLGDMSSEQKAEVFRFLTRQIELTEASD